MSRYFKENKGDSLKNIFDKKLVYRIVTKSKYGNLIDFTFAEKALYGRVDRLYQPIVPHENVLQMKYIAHAGIAEVQVFNFVADAFQALRNKFSQKVMKREINDKDPYLSKLDPVLGYQNPKQLYQKYRQAYSQAVGNIVNKNRLKFTNFKEFINVIMPYIENSLKKKTFTYAAYVKSKDCPISVSGLAIELGNRIDSNDDKFKYDNFYKSPNWEFFLNACNTYGFMVDVNMPNRIVADIGSPEMASRMRAYNTVVEGTDSFLHYCYDTAYKEYFAIFQLFFYELYSSNKKRTIVTTTENYNDGTRSTIGRVKTYSFEQFKQEYGNLYFLDLYCKIRFLEEESHFDDYEKHSLTENTRELAKVNFPLAIESFEKILNKTFDYDGSLGYILNRNKELEK
jgi:hypothetical protein